MKPTITRFIHLRWLEGAKSIAAKGGLTIAYDVVNINNERVVLYAVAKCNEKDPYNKRVGRDKSAGRLMASNHDKYGSQLILPLEASWKDIKDAIILDAVKKWPWSPLLQAESRRIQE